MQKTINCCLPPSPPSPPDFQLFMFIIVIFFYRVKVFISFFRQFGFPGTGCYILLSTDGVQKCPVGYLQHYIYKNIFVLAACNLYIFFGYLQHILLFFGYLQHILFLLLATYTYIFLATYNTYTFFATCIIPDIQIL